MGSEVTTLTNAAVDEEGGKKKVTRWL